METNYRCVLSWPSSLSPSLSLPALSPSFASAGSLLFPSALCHGLINVRAQCRSLPDRTVFHFPFSSPVQWCSFHFSLFSCSPSLDTDGTYRLVSVGSGWMKICQNSLDQAFDVATVFRNRSWLRLRMTHEIFRRYKCLTIRGQAISTEFCEKDIEVI